MQVRSCVDSFLERFFKFIDREGFGRLEPGVDFLGYQTFLEVVMAAVAVEPDHFVVLDEQVMEP